MSHPSGTLRFWWRSASATLLAAASLLTVPSAALAATGLISTVAGTGTAGAGGNGVATGTQLGGGKSVRSTPDGGFVYIEEGFGRVRKVSPSGNVTTIAGNGTLGFSGDGGPATSAQLNAPSGVVQLADGSYLIADSQNHRVRKVGTDGKISTVAGTGAATFGGDGGPATAAKLNYPFDVVPTPDGGYLIADTDNQRIRKVAADGKISTVAGTGTAASTGDGGAATAATLNKPFGVDVYPNGDFLIAEWAGNEVRKVTAGDGKISRLAGGGATANPANGSQATSALYSQIYRVAVMPDGGFVFAELDAQKIRRVLPGGAQSTIAGTGTAGFNGDGIAATTAKVNNPTGVGVTAEGDVLIADYSNSRIRSVDLGDPLPPATTPVITPPVETPVESAPTISRITLRPPTLGVAIRPATTRPSLSPGKLPIKSPALSLIQIQPDPAATQLKIDTNADSKGDVLCPADEPAFGAYGGTKQTLHVSVASSNGDDQSAFSDSTDMAIAADPNEEYSSVPYLRCTPNIEAMTATVPLPVCSDQTVVFGVVSAHACMFHDTNADVSALRPVDVRPMIDNFRALRTDLPKQMALDGYWTKGKLEVSGLTITPLSGSSVFLAPQYERIVASNASVRVAGMQLKTGRIDLDLNTAGRRVISLPGYLPTATTTVPLFTLDATGLKSAGGLARVGLVSVSLMAINERRFAHTTFQLRLPDEFAANGSKPPTAPATLDTSVESPSLSGLTIKPADVDTGVITMREIGMQYDPAGSGPYGCATNAWVGSTKPELSKAFGLGQGMQFQPASADARSGFVVCDGTFGGSRVQSSGFDIAGLAGQPIAIHLGGRLNAPGVLSLTGTTVIVGATEKFPYTLTGRDGDGFELLGNTPPLKAFTLATAGSVNLDIPVLGPVLAARGYVVHQPGYTQMGGDITLSTAFGLINVNGRFNGEVSELTRKFNFNGSVQGCIGSEDSVLHICLPRLYGWLSQKGVTVCTKDIVGTDFVPGMSYTFGGAVVPWFPGSPQGGCKPSTTWETNVRGARARAAALTGPAGGQAVRASARRDGGAVSFKLAKDQRAFTADVKGKDGAPSVTVRGPDGETVTVGGGVDYAHGATIAAYQLPVNKTTYVGVIKGKPGDYTVTPAAGSSPISGLATTRASDHAPEGEVTKDGDQRVLHYDIGDKAPGEVVTFVELGGASDIIIGTASKATGDLRYTPATGPGGERRIVARTEVQGVPAPDVDVAKYNLSSSVTAPKPAKVNAKRAGKGLKVSWKSSDGAESYGIRVIAADGTETFAAAPKGATKVTVPNIAKEWGGKVEVSAKGASGDFSKPAKGTFKATATPINRFVTKKAKKK